jgi:hypothetical protein
MSDLLDRINGQDLLPIVIVSIVFGSGLLFLVTALITKCVHAVRRDVLSAQLKQDMLDRGMSAEEIKMVLEAGLKD